MKEVCADVGQVMRKPQDEKGRPRRFMSSPALGQADPFELAQSCTVPSSKYIGQSAPTRRRANACKSDSSGWKGIPQSGGLRSPRARQPHTSAWWVAYLASPPASAEKHIIACCSVLSRPSSTLASQERAPVHGSFCSQRPSP